VNELLQWLSIINRRKLEIVASDIKNALKRNKYLGYEANNFKS